MECAAELNFASRVFTQNGCRKKLIESKSARRHAPCKEGYHGLRCDQFVPKTDSILSDPTDELGIEFMESRETYQRQVLSIFSIASGICFLGVACIALYRHNKRHREKLWEHFSESGNLRECGVNPSGVPSKSNPRSQSGRRLQKTYSKRAAPDSTEGNAAKSTSLSVCPAQGHPETRHFKTPPITRGPRAVGPNYKPLKEVESAEFEGESIKRHENKMDATADDRHRGGFLNMQTLSRVARKQWKEVPCTRLDGGLMTPPPPSLRAHSVPIIPSLQGDERESVHEHGSGQGVLQVAGLAGSVLASSSSSDTLLESEAGPSHKCSRGANTAPGSETCRVRRGASDAPIGSGRVLQHSSLGASGTASAGSRLSGTNTVIDVTVFKGKSIQYTPRLHYSCPCGSGPQAREQSQVLGPGEQHVPLIHGAACLLSAAVGRGIANDTSSDS
ncbi:hypothetical protein DPEC_G00356860 [Dallia pectoralis]|uniref:Uncharacterized protein n=1 Tax=Dallia pectoralis TaxID=75939 RepID=A0ACC2EZU1_DALPE|nr:hypothetical protein DPEC_G00356860 [Dallia pectoralis]